MAPWRVARDGAKERLVVGSRPFLRPVEGVEPPYRGLPAFYEGKLYDSVSLNSVRATPDLKHIAYLAKDGDRLFVVVDHREEPAIARIAYDTIRLSNDGSRVAYAINTHSGGYREWIADGQKLAESHFMRELAFSPDGKRLAYHVTTGKGQTRLYLDGKVVASYEMASLRHLTFSPDSQRLLYVLEKQGTCAVVDGREGPVFERIKWNYPGWDQVFFFSPDHKRVAYVGQREGMDTLVVDQSPGEPLQGAQILGMKFSPDSRHLAVMAGGPNQKWFVILDGTPTTPRGHVIFNRMTFSPDGRYLAYVTRTGDGWTVVVNDVAGIVYEKIACAGRSPLRFISANQLRYVAWKGDEMFIVDEHLASPPSGR